MTDKENTEEQIVLLWLSKSWDEDLFLIHEGKEVFKNTLAYQILNMKYAAAPIVLSYNRLMSKTWNLLLGKN